MATGVCRWIVVDDDVAVINYEWVVHVGTSPIVWSRQGDEWIHRLRDEIEALSRGISASSVRYDESTRPFITVELIASDGEPDGVVLLGVTETEVLAFAAGNGPADDTVLAAVADAVRQVDLKMGDEGNEHRWSAVLGPPPDAVGGRSVRLASTAIEVETMHIESSNVVMVEPGSPVLPTLSGWSVHSSVPIRVAGTSAGYSWDAASGRAARDLRTVCGLLSVAWDAVIAVREAAQSLDTGVSRAVPDHPPWYAMEDGERPTGVPGEPVEIPEWFGDAWRRLHQDAKLQAALDIFLEGFYCEAKHPSLAVVAFTACIETLAASLYSSTRCGECGSQRGIAKSFRAALRLVVDEDEARELGAVYGSRSKTVHAGTLHGEETQPGVRRFPVWSDDPARAFLRTRWRLRAAARLLMIRALRGELPAEQPLA